MSNHESRLTEDIIGQTIINISINLLSMIPGKNRNVEMKNY